MPKLVVADASCLIVLIRIDALSFLQKLYGSILTTPVVANEVGRPLPPWILEVQPRNQVLLSEFEAIVDRGEASAIALAIELEDCSVILDDEAGRRLARRLQLDLTGTLGVLLRCRQEGLISRVGPYLDQLRSVAFRMSDELIQSILHQAGER